MKKVLILSPYYEIYPPENGGMQRCFFMLPELVKYFDTTLIMYQDKESFELSYQKYPTLKKLKLISILQTYKEPNDIFSFFPKRIKNSLRYRWQRKVLFESAYSSFIHLRVILKGLLKINKFNIIIIENINDVKLSTFIKQNSPKTKIVYEAHNIDSDLSYIKYIKGNINKKSYLNDLKIESNLYKTCDGVICFTKEDEIKIKLLNKNLVKTTINSATIPIPDKMANSGTKDNLNKSILFCGSLSYQPNSEGIIWFINEVWPKLIHQKDIHLIIIGSGNQDESMKNICNKERISLIGRVENVWEYYNKASVVIVPILTGSGIRLKILEAMAMGVPIVSTFKGAEGINYTINENILIADDPLEFSNNILLLINDINKRIKFSKSGRNLIETAYNWINIGYELKEFLESFS